MGYAYPSCSREKVDESHSKRMPNFGDGPTNLVTTRLHHRLYAMATPPNNYLQLPSALLISAETGQWSFHAIKVQRAACDIKRLIHPYCCSLTRLPIRQTLSQYYNIYADAQALPKRLSMNHAANPVMEYDDLLKEIQSGGPLGNLVLYRKGGLALKDLQRIVNEEDYAENDMGVDASNPFVQHRWCDLLHMAVKAWALKVPVPPNGPYRRFLPTFNQTDDFEEEELSQTESDHPDGDSDESGDESLDDSETTEPYAWFPSDGSIVFQPTVSAE